MSESGNRETRDVDLDCVLADFMRRVDQGERVDRAALVAAHPELADELRAYLSHVAAIDGDATAATAGFDDSATPRSGGLEVRCPNCHQPTEVAVDTTLTDLTCSACGSHFSLVDQSQATRMAPALTKLGRFELIERLGVGGFGSVWKARDKELDRTVAIKIPRQGVMTSEDQEKFFREARAAAQLCHPNIVSVHEVGRDGDSIYIVSDFVRGVTLGDWLTGQKLTSREAAELCAKIADALHHAHEQGVVHRDLKPANIMIDGEGQPHLMDFGLARREAGEVTVTMDGHVLGTPAYMSPEQAEGKAHTADRRSDVYSLGVILFQLLTGELPFRGNARMLIHQVIYDEPPSPRKLNSNVPKDLEVITLKCLEKRPAQRFSTALDVADELNRFLRGEPIQSRPVGRFVRTYRLAIQKPLAASFVGFVIFVAIVGPIVAWRESQRATQLRTSFEERDLAYAAQEQAKLHAQRQLTKLHLSTAAHFQDEDQVDAALLWNARAWQEDPDADQSEANHRLRLGLGVLAKPELVGLAIHDSPIEDAKIDNAGEIVFALTSKGEATLWKIREGTVLAGPLPHPSSVNSIALTRDGTCAATGGTDGIARIWNAATGRPIHSLEHGAPVECVAFSPNDDTIVTAGGDAGVRLWNRRSSRAIGPPISVSGAYFVAFSSDGEKLVTADAGGNARVWNATTHEPISPPLEFTPRNVAERQWQLRRGPVFSPDGARILTATGQYYNPRDRGQISMNSVDGSLIWGPNGGAIHDHVFNSSGELLLASGTQAYLIDAATGRSLSTMVTPRECQRVAFITDLQVATASTGGEIQFWNLAASSSSTPGTDRGSASQTRPTPLTFGARCCDTIRVLLPVEDGRFLLAASKDGTVRLYETQSATNEISQLASARPDLGTKSIGNFKMVYSRDGAKECLYGGPIPAIVNDRSKSKTFLLDNAPPISRALFSDDGEILVLANKEEIQAWSAVNGQPIGPRVTLKQSGWANLAVSGNGRCAAIGSQARSDLCVIDLETGTTLLQQDYPITDRSWDNVLALTHDGGWLVTGDYRFAGAIEIWDTRTAKCVRRFYPHRGVLSRIDLSADGSKVLICSSDTTVRLWDVQSGDPLGPPLLHSHYCSSGRMANNGRWALTTDLGRHIHLWDAINGTRFARWSIDAITRNTDAWFATDGNSIEQCSEGVFHSFPIRSLAVPSESLLPLLKLFTGKQIDTATDGVASLPPETFFGNPQLYLQSWRTWRESLRNQSDAQPTVSKDAALLDDSDLWPRVIATLEESIADLREKEGPDHPGTLAKMKSLADIYSEVARFAEASELYGQLRTSKPDDVFCWYNQAICLLGANQMGDYQRVCREMMAHFGDTKDTILTARTCYACVPAPIAEEDAKMLVQLANVALAQPNNERIMGAALFRAGDFEQARQYFKTWENRKRDLLAWDHTFMAMIEHRLGHANEAAKHLAAAKQKLSNTDHWRERIEVKHLFEEAKALLGHSRKPE